MKLISLYIENFGCFSGFELDFNTGITTINRPNGFGKTTLAEFIRAMFYGFPRKTKTLEKSKRQKYTPWNGGSFGGSLVFAYEGKRYRIERSFGSTPKGDTFTLIDLTSNRRSNRFSADIGMELFGLDSDSFERSTYLPQMQEEGILTTAAIQAKLSNLVEDSSDVGNYDKAITILRAKRSALIPYRGSGGSVAETAGQMTQLQLQLDLAQQRYRQLLDLREEAARTEKRLEHIKTALGQIQQKQSAAAAYAVQAVRQGEYQRLCQAYEQICMQIDAIFDAYPAGFPELSELSTAEATADRLAVLENQIACMATDVQPKEHLRNRMGTERPLPSQEELAMCRRKCEAFTDFQQKLHEAEAALTKQMQMERDVLAMQPPKSPATAVIAAWAISLSAVGAGAVLMYMQQYLYGAVALGIGVAAMAVAAAQMLTRSKRRNGQLLKQQQASDQRIAAAQEHVAALRRQSGQCCEEIVQFLGDFGIDVPPQHFPAGLARLEHKVGAYDRFRQWKAVSTQLRSELEDCFLRYGQKPEGDLRIKLRQMRDALQEYRMLGERKQKLAGQLAQMEREFPQISSALPPQAEDESALEEQARSLLHTDAELTEMLLRQKQDIRLLQAQTEQIPSLQEELERLQGQLTADRESVRILDETMAFLQQARECLSTAYMGTIRSRFDCYLGQLGVSTGEKYLIDTELQVQLERMGQTRELAYFSAGQTDLVMLCMRLALVDALFKAEDMFIILDDPFVNLDDVHTAQACKLLQTLAQKRQIIYLTCHSSRSI